MIFGIALAVVAIVVIVLRIRFVREIHDRRLGPHLHDRVMLLFDGFEGKSIDADQLEQLERDAQQRFVDTLTGVGLVPTGWRVRVRVDELLGPVPEVIGPKGEPLTLGEFEARLREGRIELEAA